MLIGAIGQYFFGITIFVSSIFLILLVLVQRGRGGGLTGALGGPGGQSAFGTKAGDLFTRITIGVAVVWILLCASSVVLLKSRGIPTLGAGTANTPDASGTIEGLGESADLGDPSNTLNSGGSLGPETPEESSSSAASEETSATESGEETEQSAGSTEGEDSASTESAAGEEQASSEGETAEASDNG